MARFDTDLPEPFVHTGFAPGGAPMGMVVEVLHGLREIPQRLLLHGVRPGRQPRVLGASRSQLGTLLVVAAGPPSRLPVLVLLDRQIPHELGMAAVLGQRRGLLSGGNQPEPGHPRNVTNTTDKLMEARERRSLYRLKPAESTPQI